MEELLTCSVCCEGYTEKERNPIVLPRCGHSFCRPCMNLIESGGCVICPTCRTDQRIGSVNSLPTEYTLLAIIHARENTKHEECDIHCVKLSFWCRTCMVATCGECLFEDHPTHSHDVIRAARYITEIQDQAQDVANKFLDNLDRREKSHYKHIFHYAHKISNAIRNISILRKDMDNARELMRGIKDQESIKAASSLSEASKFLGLKWNIQDANFNQSPALKPKEETVKEEKERESPSNKESDKKTQIPDDGETLTKKKKEKKEKDDKVKKSSLRKSKTMSAFEPKVRFEEVEDNKEREEREEENKLNLTKTSSPLIPIIPEIIINQEELPKDHTTLIKSKTGLTKVITKSKTQIFDPIDEKINSIEAETKSVIENNPELEEKIAAVNKKFRILKKSAIKEGLKINTEEAAATNLPDLVENKEEPIVEEVPQKTEEKEEKDEKESVEENKEEIQESIKEESEKRDIREEDDQIKAEAKLMDVMQAPEFSLSMEADDGKIARTEWCPLGLMIFCHQFQHVEYDVCLKSSILSSLIPSKSPIAFVEFSAAETVIGTVYIELWGHLKRAHNFLSLCLGDQGPSFLLTKFLQVYNLDGEGERILGGDYEFNNGRGGKGIIDDLEWNGDYARPMESGMITAAGCGQNATNSLFLICTKSDETRNFSCPFGIIKKGFEHVQKAIQESEDKQIWITNCGALIQTRY